MLAKKGPSKELINVSLFGTKVGSFDVEPMSDIAQIRGKKWLLVSLTLFLESFDHSHKEFATILAVVSITRRWSKSLESGQPDSIEDANKDEFRDKPC